MPIITREDGERFVIPSYRDTINAKKTSQLRKEINALSANYGEYITLQKKNVNQYEVAFSSDTGYLLGECVWQNYKRPIDMVYCEALPNSTEALLVIVKSGTVYLDGTFHIDSIPEELVIFKTQENNFSIYIYGDVPISDRPEDDKFSFDPSSVRDFTVLDEPLFPVLPTFKNFQLQPVETVLAAQGIGVFPLKPVIFAMVAIALIWFAWDYISTHKKSLPTVIIGVVNPYQLYYDQLSSPSPVNEMETVSRFVKLVNTIPGWIPDTLDYTPSLTGTSLVRVGVKSTGARTDILIAWAAKNNAKVEIAQSGIFLNFSPMSIRRPMPSKIFRLQDVTVTLVDRLSYVLTGNNMTLGPLVDKRTYSEQLYTINFSGVAPFTFDLIGQQLVELPMILNKVTMTLSNSSLSGTIILKALGN